MNILDWIRSLFGRGRVTVEWSGLGPKGIQSGTGRCPYVGSYDEHAIMDHFKKELRYQHDIVVTNIRVVSHLEG